jgi:hypothetical protein
MDTRSFFILFFYIIMALSCKVCSSQSDIYRMNCCKAFSCLACYLFLLADGSDCSICGHKLEFSTKVDKAMNVLVNSDNCPINFEPVDSHSIGEQDTTSTDDDENNDNEGRCGYHSEGGFIVSDDVDDVTDESSNDEVTDESSNDDDDDDSGFYNHQLQHRPSTLADYERIKRMKRIPTVGARRGGHR